MPSDRVRGIGSERSLIQRTCTIRAIQLAIGEGLLRLTDHSVDLSRGVTRLGDLLGQLIHITAAAEQFARNGQRLIGIVQLAGLQRGIGTCHFRHADLMQTLVSTVVIRFQRIGLLVQFTRTGAVIAIQMALLQCRLRTVQHVVEIGIR